MSQTVTFEVAEADAQVLQALVVKARDAGKTIAEMFAGMKERRHPLMLDTDSGTVVFQDLASYERLLEEIETAEAIAGIKRGLESVREGRGKPLDEAFAELRSRLNLPEKRCPEKRGLDALPNQPRRRRA